MGIRSAREKIRIDGTTSHEEKTNMGLTYAKITLANGIDYGQHKQGKMPKKEVRHVKVNALVDSGAFMLAINETIQKQLDLPAIEKKEVSLADGSVAECDIVGPVYVFFRTRKTACQALVLPGNSEVLLGAIPIEDMDVIIDLKNNKLRLPTIRPYIARTILK